MRKLESIEDRMNGMVTYELDDGKRLRVDARLVQKIGIAAILREYGYEAPTERLPVYQRGRKVGTVPADFDPEFIKSRSFFYEPRPGDFKREGDGWVAEKMLGPGDLDAVPGFRRILAKPD